MPAKKRDTTTDKSRMGAIVPPVTAPLLPHEHDESVAVPAAPQPIMIQAQRDLARGLEETDCYTRIGKMIPRLRKK